MARGTRFPVKTPHSPILPFLVTKNRSVILFRQQNWILGCAEYERKVNLGANRFQQAETKEINFCRNSRASCQAAIAEMRRLLACLFFVLCTVKMPTMPFFPRFYSVLPKSNRFDYSLIKNNRRKARKNNLSEEVRMKSKPVHAIRDIYPWKNKQQFVDHLAENVIYNKDGLIAINKPYGVPLLKNGLVKGINESLFSIEEALTPLASLLNVEKLLPAKMVERFASGISLFASQEKVVDKIRQSYVTNKAKKIHTFKYLAVTIGEPKPSSSRGTVGMGFFEHQDVEGKLLAIMKDYSNRKVADGLVREFRVHYETLSHGGEPCSLVEVDVSSAKNHFLRVYLAHLFSPVLGDHIFGNRVQEIMGKRLAISPLQADNLSIFQKIPTEILTRLKVTESGIVPNCLHLSQMTLAKFASQDSNLVLRADPPPCFQYICQAFGLDLPKDESVVLSHV